MLSAPAIDEVVWVLQHSGGDQPFPLGDPQQLHHLGAGEIAHADVPRLALGDDIGHRLLDRLLLHDGSDRENRRNRDEADRKHTHRQEHL